MLLILLVALSISILRNGVRNFAVRLASWFLHHTLHSAVPIIITSPNPSRHQHTYLYIGVTCR
jgi:hypothetical protein